jgi:hypothetical protein
MKLPKLDLSKQGLSRFWLHHAEKLVLGLSLILLGLFAWFGFSTPRYTAKTPSQVVDLARQAEGHIKSPESWNQMQNFRTADTSAPERIRKAADFDVETAKYQHDLLVGPVVKTLGLRQDPELRPVEELIAKSGTFPILYPANTPDELRRLPRATAEDDAKKDNKKDDNKKESAKKGDKADPLAPGKALTDVQKQEMPGVRATYKVTGESAGTVVQDVVAVTGVIPYENQFAEYQKVFASAQGYYPVRDIPIYRTLQIQRREEGGEWTDITQQVLSDASLVAGDKDSFVPDYIDPKYYYGPVPGGDPITGAIPPIVMMDYKDFVGHPKVPVRQTVPTALKREFSLEEEQFQVNRDPLAKEKFKTPAEIKKEREQEEVKEIQKIKSRVEYDRFGKRIKPVAPYKLVRFFDLRAPKGKRVQYRVRLWLPDPNDPDVLKLSDKKEVADAGQKRDQPSAGAGGLDGGGADESQQGPELEEDGLEKDLDVSKAKKMIVEQRMLDAKVRERLVKGLELPDMPANPTSYKYLVPTPWSNETDPVLVGGDDYRVFAGKVAEPPYLRVEGVEIPRFEPTASVVAAELSRDLNTVVPALKPEARRGEVLNFAVPKAHVLNPKDGSVRVYSDATVSTNAVVVDLQGGEKLKIRGAKIDFFAPSELLVMDAQGNFHLQNELADYRGYRHALFRDDESSEYGKKKEKEKPEEKNGGDDRMPPGG